MEIVPSQYGTAFYVLSLLLSGSLFFWLRRLFRRRLASEAAALAATVLASVLAMPFVVFGLAVLFHFLARS
jgi:predicted permease